jgi:hypothetical protein
MRFTLKGIPVSFSNTLSIQILELVFYFLLNLSYILVVSPAFSYMGFEYEFNITRILISLVLVIAFVQLGKWAGSGLMYAIWHMVLIICLFPNLVFYTYSSGHISSSMGYIIFLLILFLFSRLKLHNINSKVIPIQEGSNLPVILIITFILFVPFLSYLPHINLRNLWLADIYETRTLFREISHWSFLSYLLSPLSRVLLPALIVISIKRRNYPLLLLVIILTAYLYLSSGALKSVYFGIFAAVFFYFGKGYKSKLLILIVPLILIMVLGILEFEITQHLHLQNLAVRRVFFIPPLIEDTYYNFFSGHDKTHYTHSLLSFFGDPGYGMSLSRYIGEVVMGNEGFNANVGVIPDGFLSLGWLGVIINSVLISYTFLLLDRFRIDPIFFGVIFTYIYYFNTAFLGTMLLTHGYLFLLLFAFFSLKDPGNNHKELPIEN